MNTKLEEIVLDLEQLLSKNRNPEKALKMKAYMKHKFDFLGIQMNQRKILSVQFKLSTKNLSIEELWQISDLLWDKSEREYQYVAMDMWSNKLKLLKSEDISRIEMMILKKSWWDTVDWLAARMAGHCFSKHTNVQKEFLNKWIKSKNIWLNRTCLLHQLFYKDKTDFELLQWQILQLKHKNEFFIQKAIGWSLRQYSKTNPSVVQEYVHQNELSSLAQREALKWMNK
jgi:3-methyladenine DNA glycosylase AlkD